MKWVRDPFQDGMSWELFDTDSAYFWVEVDKIQNQIAYGRIQGKRNTGMSIRGEEVPEQLRKYFFMTVFESRLDDDKTVASGIPLKGAYDDLFQSENQQRAD